MQIWIQVSITNQVTLGDGKKSNVEGKGVVVVVNTKSGDKKQIYGVLYVPNLTHNFLSVGQLVKRGYFVAFDNDECAVIDKKCTVTLAKMKMAENNVFSIYLPQNENVALQVETYDESYIWHLRYGHLNQKALQLLKQNDMVIRLPHW